MAPKSKAKSGKAGTSTDKEAANPVAKPNWPILSPLIDSGLLSLETLHEGQILLIRDLFTSTLCKKYVSFLSTLPLTTTPGKPRRGEAIRVNDRFQVEDAVFAERLWKETALNGLVFSSTDSALRGAETLGLNSNIRIYRYRPGQFFDQHYDESNKIEFGTERTKAVTTWTLLIYLTVCEGGETVFYPESSGRKGEAPPKPIVAELEVGLALLHKHGDDCLLHEGREVTKGEKWVLRSDLVVKR